MQEMCNCEYESHFPDNATGHNDHAYGNVPAGIQLVKEVGKVCDKCANTHMKKYLV